jgi:hypothetical protein
MKTCRDKTANGQGMGREGGVTIGYADIINTEERYAVKIILNSV